MESDDGIDRKNKRSSMKGRGAKSTPMEKAWAGDAVS
jgi:hypothetical protein